MADFLQTLITVIAVGALYALVALGYTMVYGILKFINFAHSDVFVLGAWSAFSFATVILSAAHFSDERPIPLWVGAVVLVGAMSICGLFGLLIERLAYKPLRRAPRLNVLITAIGVSLFLQNIGQIPPIPWHKYVGAWAADVRYPFGASPQRMPALLRDRALNESAVAVVRLAEREDGTFRPEPPIALAADRSYRLDQSLPDGRVLNFTVAPPPDDAPPGTLRLFPSPTPDSLQAAGFRLILLPLVPIQLVDVVIFVSAIVLMLALEFLVFRTRMGMAMRAVSFNTDSAALMGVPVDRVISFTFVTGTALAAAAGFLWAVKYPSLNQTAHEAWVLLGLKAFVAAVVGGIGNIRGAVLGGFLIAFIEFFGAKYIDTNLRDVYVFAVLILVLLLRPSGLLGSPVREKV